MYRATTPKHYFLFKEIDPRELRSILITYVQNNKIVFEKNKSDLIFDETTEDGWTMHLDLTQEEANLFSRGTAQVQLRVVDQNGQVFASDPDRFSIDDVLNDEVLQ